jgi:hypothetical protein
LHVLSYLLVRSDVFGYEQLMQLPQHGIVGALSLEACTSFW